MRILCTSCGKITVEGRCPNCGKPPMAAQLKMALLALLAVVVLGAMSLMAGVSDTDPKKKPAAAAPKD